MSNVYIQPELSSEERLNAFKLLTEGCSHCFSKGVMDKEKVIGIIQQFVELGYKDPEFLARFAAYAMTKTKNKDLQTISIFANSLNSADGMPIKIGSKYNKPQWREVSAAAIQIMNPKLATRVREIAKLKFEVSPYLGFSSHLSTRLSTAFDKYLTYREKNLNILKGIRKSGLKNTMIKLYKFQHKAPTDEAAGILAWNQGSIKKGNKKEVKKETPFDFKGMKPIEIAKKIRREKLPVLGVLGALPKVTPTIAVALLEQMKPDEAIILRKTLEDTGVLKDKEVMKLFEEKIKGARGTIDRVRKIKDMGETVGKAVKKVKAEVRKDEMGDIGKIYIHLDRSSSMDEAIEFAKEKGAIIAEMVKNPEENFRWGAFNDRGKQLDLPDEFVEDAFRAKLFGLPANGATNCLACYEWAREFGADVDIFLSDGGHNEGNMTEKIRKFHEKYPDIPKPKCVVLVDFPELWHQGKHIKPAFEANNIPVAVLKPETITESSLVTEAVSAALYGEMAFVDSIMKTEMLALPEWYGVV